MRGAILLVAISAVASAEPLVPREPFANAHVSFMARTQARATAEAKLSDVDLWAEGSRLRALVRGDPKAGQFWVDGLASEALWLVDGKVAEPRKRSLEHALQLSLAATAAVGRANTDRIAGHPCKIVTEELEGGFTLTRCIWRGVPLSVRLIGKGGFEFNAAATLVEEGAVTVADLQPPPGAPAAPASMSAGR